MNEKNSYLASISTEKVNEATQNLDMLNGEGIAALMNDQDALVTECVKKAIPQIGKAIDIIADKMQAGGRLFYMGAGTSGRLGVLDASECPPTFGVDSNLVCGIIAGGDTALRNAAEGAEDVMEMGKQDLQNNGMCAKDVVVAISASGFAPYCIGGLLYAKELGAVPISLCCNENTRLSEYADIAIEVPTGAEVLSGSTRLKAGTATKMVLNMLTTGAMVRIGKTYKNLMVDLRATNTKLRDRSLRILMYALNIERQEAENLYISANESIKTAIVMYKASASCEDSEKALKKNKGFVNNSIKELLA